jgi:alanyl-tRNA synthetase
MVQFKAHFLQQIPLTFTRAASSQRCLRTTDIDQVGRTPRHHTFFEMLGNFSFGDYFKEDAILWGWEFLTKQLSLPKERLWITIYKDDEEAGKIWKKFVPESKIVKMGDDTNFWTMGPTGPCGPCSEIHWDLEGKNDGAIPDDSARWMEVWNLVFTQYDRQEDGKLLPLPKKNIDTGMGLERLTAVAEGVKSNFETSLFKPLVGFAENTFKTKIGADEKKNLSIRIVADHLRAITFLVYDGILPSNEGRGYVLRRLLRRATRQGQLFGVKDAFLYKGVPTVVDLMKETATDLVKRQANIQDLIKQEEERFLETLETGSEKLSVMIKAKKISGEDVFKLYDTYGFPPELTKEILEESSLSFDQKAFDKAREEAQGLSREGWKGSGAQDVTVYNELFKKIGASKFLGYETLNATAAVKTILKKGKSVDALRAGEEGEIIAAESPFYPEGGGQVGDKGFIKIKNDVAADVLDTQKPVNGLIVHLVKAKKDLKVGDTVEFAVDPNHRYPTVRHHTATHLLHAALRKVLGTSVTQAGSLVAPEKLRFDYTANKAPTPEQIRQIEDMVNEAVLKNMPARAQEFPADVARKMGAMALFGEKYGDKVRCLLVSEYDYTQPEKAFSLELCGGTHAHASGDIGAFKIISDASISAGVRRMEAVAGTVALDYFRGIEQSVLSIADKLKATPAEVQARVSKLIDKQKSLEQEIRDLKLKLAQGGGNGETAAPAIQNINGIQLAINVADGLDTNELRTLVDRLKTQIKSGVVFAASAIDDEGKEKISFVVATTPDMKEKGVNAGAIAKAAAAELGGSGGGRPDFAQGGGQGKDKLQALLKKIPSLIK